jgi:tetratricopeptide (TPR) repeat protein
MKIFSLVFVLFLFSFLFQTPLSADIKQESLESYRTKGLEAQQKGFLEDALAYYQKALSLDPGRADI